MNYLKILLLPLTVVFLISCSRKSQPAPDKKALLQAKLKGSWKYAGFKLADRQDTWDTYKQYYLDRRVTGYYETVPTAGSVEIGDSSFIITGLSYSAASTYSWYEVPGTNGVSAWHVNVDKYHGQTVYHMVSDDAIHFSKPLLQGLNGGVEADVPFEGESTVSWSLDTLIIMTVTEKTASYTSNDTLYKRQSNASIQQKFVRK